MSNSNSNVKIIVPSLGESVSEATVAKWYKKVGDAVQVDDILVELETEKVSLEVNAQESGVLNEVTVAVGSTVAIGDILGFIEKGAVAVAAKPVTPMSLDSAPMTQNSAPKQPIQQNDTAKVIASPAANKIASDRGVNLENISGSGKDGRITKGDVLDVSLNVHASVSSVSVDNNRENKVPMTRLRKTIAKRLKDSQNTAAILTTFNEIDMFEVIRLRQVYQDKFKEKHGIKLGFMSFFVKASVIALKEIPNINAEIRGDNIIYKNYYDIGVAVGTDQGLVVPIVRDADKLSFANVELSIATLGKKAKEGKLSMGDMTGGTFSITNGGIYGSLLSTPIINPPQSGILGMHNIVERPIAVAGQVVVRPMTYVALSYDHRIVDGKEAVTFLVRIKELIEKPERLILDI